MNLRSAWGRVAKTVGSLACVLLCFPSFAPNGERAPRKPKADCRRQVAYDGAPPGNPDYQLPYANIASSVPPSRLEEIASDVITRVTGIAYDRYAGHESLLHDGPAPDAHLLARLAHLPVLETAVTAPDSATEVRRIERAVREQGEEVVRRFVRKASQRDARKALARLADFIGALAKRLEGVDPEVTPDIETAIDRLAAKLVDAREAEDPFPGPDEAMRAVEDSRRIQRLVPGFRSSSDPATNPVLGRLVGSIPRSGYSGYAELKSRWLEAYRQYPYRPAALEPARALARELLGHCPPLYYACYEVQESIVDLERCLMSEVFGANSVAQAMGLIFFEETEAAAFRRQLEATGLGADQARIIEENLETIVYRYLETSFTSYPQ